MCPLHCEIHGQVILFHVRHGVTLYFETPSHLEYHTHIHTYLDSSMKQCDGSGGANKGISERHMLHLSSHQSRKEPHVVVEEAIKERNLRRWQI